MSKASTRIIVVIAVISFIEGSSTSMLRPFIAPFAVSLGADALVVGLAVALSQAPGFIIAVPFGAAADLLGARRLLVAGVLGLSLGAALLATTTTIASLLASQLVIGIGTLGVGVALQAMATRPVLGADHDPRRVTAFSTFILVGNLVGPVAAGVLIDFRDYSTAFWAVVLLGVVSISVAPLLPRRKNDRVRMRDRVTADNGAFDARRSMTLLWSPYRGATTIFRERTVRIAVLLSGVAVMLTHLRASFLPLYFEGLGWSASLIGVVLSVAALAGVLSRVLHPLIDRHVAMWLYMGACVVLGSIAITATVATSSLPVVLIAMAVSGFMLGASNPITLTLLARSVTADRRGLAVGLRLTINRLGTAAGPLAFGALAAVGGVQATMAGMTLAGAAFGAVSSWRFRSETRLDR